MEQTLHKNKDTKVGAPHAAQTGEEQTRNAITTASFCIYVHVNISQQNKAVTWEHMNRNPQL
jgi:hypothetical protein